LHNAKIGIAPREGQSYFRMTRIARDDRRKLPAGLGCADHDRVHREDKGTR